MGRLYLLDRNHIEDLVEGRHRAVIVGEGERGDQRVDDSQLSNAAGHRLGAELGFAGEGVEDDIGMGE